MPFREKLCLILGILLIVLIFTCSSGIISVNSARKFAKTSYIGENELAQEIDESLYSRQLLVYGKTAQSRLQNAKIIVIGSNRVGEEVVKNLALTGVGHLLLCELNSTRRNSSIPSLIGNETSLIEYARSLNPYVKVDVLSSPLDSIRSLKPDLVVVAGATFSELTQINQICRASKVKMTSSGFLGMVGYVFNDFLDDFVVEDVDGETYREIPLASHSVVNGDGFNAVQLETIPEESLGSIGEGDRVAFLRRNGDGDVLCEGVVTKIVSPRICVVAVSQRNVDLQALGDGGRIKKVKTPVTLRHDPLSAQLSRPKLHPGNACLSSRHDRARSLLLLSLLKAAEALRLRQSQSHGFSLDVLEGVVRGELALLGGSPTLSTKKGSVDLLAPLLRPFVQSLGAPPCPGFTSVLGGILAGEAIKALTHTYPPLSQLLLLEALPEEDTQASRGISDDEVLREIASMRIFVVGAGAIGCELLKNLALLPKPSAAAQPRDDAEAAKGTAWGAGGLAQGGLLVTDMDQIERSNLNRQLLFRERHIGQWKSATAAQAIAALSPHPPKIHALTLPVGSATAQTFSPAFWKLCDLALPALDNVPARMYVDSRVVRAGTWMVDAGTLGTKGNVQVVIPNLTESYASSSDPPQQQVPLCTIKTFPYQPEHCVAWARDLFEQLFSRDVLALRQLLEGPGKVRGNEEGAEGLARSLQFLPVHPSLTPCPIAALRWARSIYQHEFVAGPAALLAAHPPASLDEDGAAFWGASRRLPAPLDDLAVWPAASAARDFLLSAAALRLKVLGGLGGGERQAVVKLLDLHGAAIPTTNDDQASAADEEERRKWANTLHPLSFDKDDLREGHVDFVAAAAHLRCQVYALPPLGALAVRGLAGDITPALCTTTAVVAGCVLGEVRRVARERIRARRWAQQQQHMQQQQQQEEAGRDTQQKRRWWVMSAFLGRSISKRTKDLTVSADRAPPRDRRGYLLEHAEQVLARFRNSFLDLAPLLISQAQPPAAPQLSCSSYRYTLWDHVEVHDSTGSMTLGALREALRRDYGVELTSLSWSPEGLAQQQEEEEMLLFADFVSPPVPDSTSLRDLLLRAGAPAQGQLALTGVGRPVAQRSEGDSREDEEHGEEHGQEEEQEEVALPPILLDFGDEEGCGQETTEEEERLGGEDEEPAAEEGNADDEDGDGDGDGEAEEDGEDGTMGAGWMSRLRGWWRR